MEVWKALNIVDYPLKIKTQMTSTNGVSTRADTKERPCEIGTSCLTQNSCVSGAIRIWNLAPITILNSKTLYQAKKETRVFAKTLPI